MARRQIRWFWLIILMLLAHRCVADVTPDVVERGKKATALVEVEGGRGFGTAFCIDPAGYFVTNEHVASALGGGKRLALVLNPGEKNQRVLSARVVRLDKQSDLALL